MSVIIIGAGLCGLATAYRLSQAGIDIQILEANAVAGGRIQPAIKDGHQDLGPTWVWPYAQPVITSWLNELGLELFDQFDSGSGLVDRDTSAPALQHDLPSQFGIARIRGGTHALIAALLAKLDDIVDAKHDITQFEHVVKACTRNNNQWHLRVSTPTTKNELLDFSAQQLVIAIPPRLAAPLLNENDAEITDELKRCCKRLNATPTWMAPHAKVVVFYETAFWRDQGLSGRVASQVGPLAEIHDHSGPNGTPAALFGFAGIPAQARHDNNAHFISAIKNQLKRCFGEHSPEPTNITIKDWAFEPHTAAAVERDNDGTHPQVLPDEIRKPQCGNSLWFAVAETANRSPGLIEGALARADEVAEAILRTQSQQ